MKHSYWLVIFILWTISCEKKQTEIIWNKSFYRIGSQSSPRTTDVNQDGILDIIIGAGGEEMAQTDQGVLAIDGMNGEVIWTHPAPAHVVGSATLYDLNKDGIQDVFIGGRGKFLAGIDGKTGETIWSYEYTFAEHPILQYARYNFYNSALVPDQNGDGHPDLLTVNGGNWDALPGDDSDRWPGVLMLMSLADGRILAADTMPDGQESYMSPLYFEDENKVGRIVFGSGGETFSGNLYIGELTELLNQKISKAKVIASEIGHGFIAPPTLVDLNEDGQLDIAAISHAGSVIVYSVSKEEMLWTQSFSGVESSNAMATGYFNEDKIPDLLVGMCIGVWPQYMDAIVVMLDGKSGAIEYQDSIGCFAISSPVVYDLDHDGQDEAIISTNQYDCNYTFSEDSLSPETIINQLVSIDFQKKSIQVIDQTSGFKNLFSTPWLGDMDHDGYIDLVYCQFFNPKDIQRFMGMNCKRISTPVKHKEIPKWGAYMGTQGNGIFIK